MSQWLEPQKVDIPTSVSNAVGGDELLAAALVQRGMTTAEAALAFLDPARYQPRPATDLPDLTEAADRLDAALAGGEPIVVWGDFDADGVTSTAILVETLRDLGGRVEFHIPDRVSESHGLHLRSLQKLISRGARVILTCDTGVTDLEAVAYARGQGVDVIITDHHDLGPELPQANAVVNPKRLPPTHPLHELTGVGCAYKLTEELHARRGQSGRAIRGLDLTAVGMIADVARLRDDVRFLVQRGLEELRANQRLGLAALLELADIPASAVTEEQVAFGLAPRLNALGRLSEAAAAVELFTTQDVVRARTIATEMEALNVERQLLCNQVMGAAVAIIERDPGLLRAPVLVVEHPRWPTGVLGIVAGRLAERYDRPAIVINSTSDGLARGSARSIPGVDIRAAIAAQSRLLDRFGGHPMAAGLSLPAANIAAFRDGLAHSMQDAPGQRPARILQIGAYEALSSVTTDLAARLERLAPFGAGNPPFLLATRRLKIVSQATIGRTAEHRRLVLEDEPGCGATVLWWRGSDQPLPEGLFDLAYTVRSRGYAGQPGVQIEWLEARPAVDAAVTIKGRAKTIQVTDCRTDPRPEDTLRHVLASLGDRGTVWSEGVPVSEAPWSPRDRLAAAETLVIWTIPPGPQELAHALATTSPHRLYLFARDAGLDDAHTFLSRLAGLLKYDLTARQGHCRITSIAAAMGHRKATVCKGVEWWLERGQFRLLEQDLEVWVLGPGDGQGGDRVDSLYRELQALLSETAAYRAYFRRAEASVLIPQSEK